MQESAVNFDHVQMGWQQKLHLCQLVLLQLQFYLCCLQSHLLEGPGKEYFNSIIDLNN